MSTYLDTGLVVDCDSRVDKHSIQLSIVNHVEYTLACNRCNMTMHKAMLATTLSIRDRLIEDMNDTQTYMMETKAKCVNYGSKMAGKSSTLTFGCRMGIRGRLREWT